MRKLYSRNDIEMRKCIFPPSVSLMFKVFLFSRRSGRDGSRKCYEVCANHKCVNDEVFGFHKRCSSVDACITSSNKSRYPPPLLFFFLIFICTLPRQNLYKYCGIFQKSEQSVGAKNDVFLEFKRRK